MVETVVFALAAVVILTGGIGVILARNPVHSALMLVMTLFGIAVLFVAQDAHFLAAVQVIVYAGAIVVLFLFVIMLLGVDNAENLTVEPIVGQRVAAAVVSLAVLAVVAVPVARAAQISTGARSVTGVLESDEANVALLGRALFTDYVFAFEATGALLVIAVVGAVVLARRPRSRSDAVEPRGAGRS